MASHISYGRTLRLREPRRLRQHSMGMSMEVLVFNMRVELCFTVHIKSKRRLKEAVRLLVTGGAGVYEPRKGPRLVFCAEDVGADKWIAPGMYAMLSPVRSSFLRVRVGVCFAHGGFTDWMYIALLTTEMFCMPFADSELLE
jgi:hypothetical protein